MDNIFFLEKFGAKLGSKMHYTIFERLHVTLIIFKNIVNFYLPTYNKTLLDSQRSLLFKAKKISLLIIHCNI